MLVYFNFSIYIRIVVFLQKTSVTTVWWLQSNNQRSQNHENKEFLNEILSISECRLTFMINGTVTVIESTSLLM